MAKGSHLALLALLVCGIAGAYALDARDILDRASALRTHGEAENQHEKSRYHAQRMLNHFEGIHTNIATARATLHRHHAALRAVPEGARATRGVAECYASIVSAVTLFNSSTCANFRSSMENFGETEVSCPLVDRRWCASFCDGGRHKLRPLSTPTAGREAALSNYTPSSWTLARTAVAYRAWTSGTSTMPSRACESS